MKLNKPLFPQLFKGIALFTPGEDLIYCIDPSKQSHWHMHLCAALQEMLGLVEPPHFLVPGYTAGIDRWLDPQTRHIRTSAEIYPPVQHHQALLNAVFGTGNLVWNVAPWQDGSCDPIVLETYRHQFPQLWENHDLIVRFERSEGFSYPYSNEGYSSLQETLLGPGISTRQEKLSVKNIYHVVTSTSTALENASSGGVELTASNVTNTSFGRATGLTHMEYAENSIENTNTEDLVKEDAVRSHDKSDKIDAHTQSLQAQGYVLRLFVSGNTAATEQTLKSLHQLLEHTLHQPYTLKVIDIFNHPDQAEENQISATPTLLRVWPPPVRRIVGDLNDVKKVLRILAAPES